MEISRVVHQKRWDIRMMSAKVVVLGWGFVRLEEVVDVYCKVSIPVRCTSNPRK